MDRLAGPIGACTCGPFIGTRGDRRQGREREQKENELGLQWNANKPERHAGSHERAVAVFLHVCRSVGGSSADCIRRLSNHAPAAINVPRPRVNFNDPLMRANE